jgi:arsenite-transporting ATPase
VAVDLNGFGARPRRKPVTEYVLYGGKGGVGKTTCAAATGLKLARAGHRTLVVSTDPAHSLSDSFEREVGTDPTEIEERLFATEVDPEKGAERYRQLFAALAEELRDVGIRLDPEDVDRLFAAGVAPGSDEVAALDAFVDYTHDDRFEYVIFDTAPTGHTLRLLDLPAVVGETIETAMGVRGQVRSMADSARSMVFGPAAYAMGRREDGDEFEEVKTRMDRVGELLRDPAYTEFRVVLIPEAMAIAETDRLLERLEDFEVPAESLVVNRVLEDVDEDCDRCRRQRDTHTERVAEIEERFPEFGLTTVPAIEDEVHGLDALETVADRLTV